MPRYVWDDRFYGKIALYARDGATDPEIAQMLGVHPNSLKKWRKKDVVLRDILKFARHGKNEKYGKPDGQTMAEFIYGTLPKDLQELWDEMMDWHKVKNGIRRVERLLEGQGKKARQRLFLYALTCTAYNRSEACRMCCIDPRTFDQWVVNDPEFVDMLDAIETAKKDFFESALVRAVDSGEVPAVIFANKTKNRDRGYNDKQEVEITGHMHHTHSVVDLDKLDLPLDVMKTILRAVRDHKENIVDAKAVRNIA